VTQPIPLPPPLPAEGSADVRPRAVGTEARARNVRWTVTAMVAVAVVGLTASALRAESDVWAMATLSHLSKDPGSGPLFRLTMGVVGTLGLVLAWQVGALLGRLRDRGMIGSRWAALYSLVFWVVALGFIGVGVFPLGVAPLIELAHGTAAYAIPVSVLIPMLTVRLAVPEFDERFGRASLLVLAAALLLYLAAVGSLISYALMEALAFGIGAAWFVVFVEQLVRLDLGSRGQRSDPGRRSPPAH
jgi:hypothetical protein